jgi:hypothetical protein
VDGGLGVPTAPGGFGDRLGVPRDERETSRCIGVIALAINAGGGRGVFMSLDDRIHLITEKSSFQPISIKLPSLPGALDKPDLTDRDDS